jgi:hypothetical protein
MDIDYTFLAHLRGAYTITWRPSSVVRPLAGTFRNRWIDLKLYAHVPLGQRLSGNEFILIQYDSWLGHQGAKTKNTKRTEVMAGSATNFYHRYI